MSKTNQIHRGEKCSLLLFLCLQENGHQVKSNYKKQDYDRYSDL